MFGDYEWVADRSNAQERRYLAWLAEHREHRIVAVELGAGTAIPTVRSECEQIAHTLVRINPRDADVPENGISIPLGARIALEKIADVLGERALPTSDA